MAHDEAHFRSTAEAQEAASATSRRRLRLWRALTTGAFADAALSAVATNSVDLCERECCHHELLVRRLAVGFDKADQVLEHAVVIPCAVTASQAVLTLLSWSCTWWRALLSNRSPLLHMSAEPERPGVLFAMRAL